MDLEAWREKQYGDQVIRCVEEGNFRHHDQDGLNKVFQDNWRPLPLRWNVIPPVFTLPGAKPPEIAKKALAHAKDYGNDIVILDTAGRLQIDDVLMQELVDIKEAVPVDETLLVVDAMAGQDAVNVAKTFNEKVSIDGIILTKTDGDTRGGAALSVLAVTGKPIKFQGTGEKLDDLDVFHPDRMASRILGMGDVLSLIERAQETADEKAAEETAKRMMENKFDMNDMLDQFAQIRKMGGAGAMLSMLPGGSGIDPSQVDEKAFDRIEAMIYSMTKEEREKPSIINPKRSAASRPAAVPPWPT